ncbi:MAG: VIT domain-containing protein [Planctomycetota bacterium]
MSIPLSPKRVCAAQQSRRTRILTGLAAALVLCAGVFSSQAARADGFVIVVPDEVVEPHPPRPWRHPPFRRQVHFPLKVKYHDVTVAIEDQVAVTSVDQVFVNPNGRDLEGTYIFPMPEDASVSGFSMWMGGKEVKGEVLDAKQARQIYEDIVRRTRDPALLEYVGRSLFKASVFPIPARGEARVKLRYEQVIKAEGGLIEYRYPLNTERFSSAPLERCRVAVEVKGHAKGLFSPSHAMRIDHQRGMSTAVYEAKQVLPDQDLVLYYRKPELGEQELAITLLTHKQPGASEGTFLLMASQSMLKSEGRPKDVVFCFDTSGSMSGEKLKQAKDALEYCIGALHPEDRFQVIDFATSVRSFREGLARATEGNQKAAIEYVKSMEARGGTDICGALTSAFGQGGGEDGRAFMVVFLTDGEPTIGTTEPKRIEAKVKRARQDRPDQGRDARLFAFGVGSRLNAVLIDRLVEANRGARTYVGERESIEHKVTAFFDKVSSPVFSDLTIRASEGVTLSELYPRPLPDLFRGSEIAITGTYRGEGKCVLTVGGRLAGRSVDMMYETRFRAEGGADFVPRLFAVRKVAFLLDEIRMNGESKELRNEVVRLAKRYGIVTPYTSYLVVEDAELRGGPGANHAPEKAMRRVRDQLDGYARAEEQAKRVLGGAGGRSSGAEPPSAPEALGASEAFKKLSGKSQDEAGPSVESDSAQVLARGLKETERFRQGGQQKAGEAEEAEAKAKRVLSELIRVVEGRAFYKDGEVWVDGDLEGSAATEKVVYLSDRYFELSRSRKDLRKVLALGERVRFRDKGKIIEIEP